VAAALRIVKQLDQVRVERDELAVAERVWQRTAEQLAAESAAAEPPTVQVAGPGGADGPAPWPRRRRGRAAAGLLPTTVILDRQGRVAVRALEPVTTTQRESLLLPVLEEAS
jgi:hypothetical protein